MSSQIQFKRRVNGATGSPATAGALEGEIAFNAPNAAGSTDKPVMFFYDGTAWRTVNPDVTVTTQSINLGTTGSGPGAGFTAVAATVTGNVVIGTWGSPAQAYVLTNPSAPGVDASWTSLGGAVSFAVAADITTGTDTTKALNSAALRGATVTASTGAPDKDKLVRLDATGKLDSSLMSITGLSFKGSIDASASGTNAPAAPVSGDFHFISAAGQIDGTGWTGVTTPVDVIAGDLVIYDGANWHIISGEASLSAYLPLAGGTMAATASITFAPTVKTTIIDGGSSTNAVIDNVTIDGGTF